MDGDGKDMSAAERKKKRNRERMREKRKNPEFRQTELERRRSRQAGKVARLDGGGSGEGEVVAIDMTHQADGIDDNNTVTPGRPILNAQKSSTERMQRRRSDPDYRAQEQQRDTANRRRAREDPSYRAREQERDTRARLEARSDPQYRQEEQGRANDARARNRTKWERTVENYEKAIRQGPTHVCCSCGRLWYRSSMTRLSKTSLIESGRAELANIVFHVTKDSDEAQFCTSCVMSIKNNKVPKLCLINGLELPTIPPVLKNLKKIEERLVAARHVFQSIWPIMGPNGQYKTKGGIVNVPVEVDTTVTSLPRLLDDSRVVHLRLARKMEYVKDYMSGNICPIRVFDAARHLVAQPLYQDLGVTLSVDWRSVVPAFDPQDVVDEDADGDDGDDSLPLNPGGGETLVTCDSGIRLAPAEGYRPVSILLEKDTEFLAFPKLFGGQRMSLQTTDGKTVSFADFCKSVTMRYDRRAVERNDFLLFLAKKQQLLRLTGNVSTMLRRKTNRNGEKFTAANVQSGEFLDGLVSKDHGYRVLQGVRSSGEHWRREKLKVLAMIRQFGLPTFFVTLTAAETQWPELLKFLSEIVKGEIISLDEAMALSYNEKAELIQADPVTCARFYNKRFLECKKTWNCPEGPFNGKKLTHHYYRIEFQHRGSPHSHMLLWLNDAPKFEPSDPHSETEVCSFIDSIISCSGSPVDESVKDFVKYQCHRHTATCRKKKGKTCRFDIPFFPMDKTCVLTPLQKDSISKESLQSMKVQFRALRKRVEAIDDKGEDTRSFEEFLECCHLDRETYINLIRSSLTKPKVFLKRLPRDVYINPYSPKILSLMRSNMDIQFILDAYGCATYIIDYINKADRGMSTLMANVLKEIKNKNFGVKEAMRKIANTFYNSSELSIQEAAYNLLQMPLSEASEKEIFIPTGLPEDRVRMLKTLKELASQDPLSTDIFVDGILEHYINRPHCLNNMCLAEFAAYYEYSAKGGPRANQEVDEEQAVDQQEDETPELDDAPQVLKLLRGRGTIRKRSKPKVIRFHKYSRELATDDYFRALLMLYCPWRDEKRDVINVDYKGKARANGDQIAKNRELFNYFNEDILQSAIEEAEQLQDDREVEGEVDANAPSHSFDNFSLNDPQAQADIFTDMGEHIGRQYAEEFSSPGRLTDDEYESLISKLNTEQRDYLMHIADHFRTEKSPVYHLITGGAGVGKSVLISALYQTLLRIFNAGRDADPDLESVLLCAPTGMAAFHIEGRTLHTAFHFLKDMKDTNQMSASVSNTMATALRRLEVVIIDEVSMVSTTHMRAIDARLRHIFNENLPFGGKSIILVGDFKQLPVPFGGNLYSDRESDPYTEIFGEKQIEMFETHHLTKIMRQDNTEFQTALNNLASGTLSPADMSLFESRTFRNMPSEVVNMKDAVHLFHTNDDVDDYNDAVIDATIGQEWISQASDVAIGGTQFEKQRAVRNMTTLKWKDTNCLRHRLRFKLGVRYMSVVNVDTSDGIVNGAAGHLMRVDLGYSANGASKPLRVWVKFDHPRVGKKARQKHRALMAALKIDKDWTPILPYVAEVRRRSFLPVSRKQFPLTVAEAITVHKSQGSTFKRVVVHICGRKKPTRDLMYVACSRATTKEGLWVIGEQFPRPSPIPPDHPLAIELTREKINTVPTKFSFLRSQTFDTQIMYHNIQSLPKHLKQVLPDEAYVQSDILLFGETWTVPEDYFEIPGFDLVARVDNTDAQRKARGVWAYVRSDMSRGLVGSGSKVFSSGATRIINCVWLEVSDLLVVAVYAAPNAPPRLHHELFHFISTFTTPRKLVIGDFNRDISRPDVASKVQDIAATAGLQVRPLHTGTTLANTELDIVFSNFILSAGTYTSLTSYHYPVWVGLDSALL